VPERAARGAQQGDGVTSSDVIEVPVLIVGGGPTGLCASLLLSHHGVESMTVERHPGTSVYPRATGINVRTMEIFRSLGLEEEVRRSSFSVAARVGRSRVLIDPEPELSPSFRGDAAAASPCDWTSCSQYELEPILLRAAASRREAQLMFGAELLGFDETSGGITAQVLDRATGLIREVRCQYLIAADGSKSRIREKLEIGMRGPGELMEVVSIHFCAPLKDKLPQGPNFLHFVQNDAASGIFLPTNNESRWVFAVPAGAAGGNSRELLSPARAVALVRLGAGVPDLELDVLGTVPWTMQADWAERMSAGRVFLAGDAAHRMTPAGGLGMNTGIQDVHNLSWKLAAVIHGAARPALLDTYEQERMAVAQYNVNRSVGLITGAGDVNNRAALDVDLGFTYESTAVVADGTVKSHCAGGGYEPTARPGSRAPHHWLGEGQSRVSVLDLFGPDWTLLSGQRGDTWREAADVVAKKKALPLRQHMVGCSGETADGGAAWRALYGIGETGAVLVRPDGHVAWRHFEAGRSQACALADAFDAVLAHKGQTACAERHIGSVLTTTGGDVRGR